MFTSKIIKNKNSWWLKFKIFFFKLLDGSDFKGKKVSVEKAKFEMKGNYDPTKAVKSNEHVKKLNKKKEKQLLSKQRQK